MGQSNDGFLSSAPVPEVWNESEDLGGDAVDRGKPVSPGSNQADDLESILSERVDLEYDGRKLQSTCLVR